jgi:hypothetical protein
MASRNIRVGARVALAFATISLVWSSACGGSGSTGSPAASATATPAAAPTATTAADLVFIPDAGFRMESASNPAAGISSVGTVHLYYEDRVTHRQLVAKSPDGLTFSAGVPYSDTDRTADSRRTLMPDNRTWRLYAYDLNAAVMRSLISFDGIAFTQEAGTRYAPQAADRGWMGVYEAYSEGSRVVLIYLGDKEGANNLRRAVSTDNGQTFTFDQADVLRDGALGGGGNSYVDPKTIKLPDGRRRLFVMRKGEEVDSFISTDGLSYTLEAGKRLTLTDFTSIAIRSLNDPVVVRLSDGRYRMYVAALVSSTNEFSIVSATTR